MTDSAAPLSAEDRAALRDQVDRKAIAYWRVTGAVLDALDNAEREVERLRPIVKPSGPVNTGNTSARIVLGPYDIPHDPAEAEAALREIAALRERILAAAPCAHLTIRQEDCRAEVCGAPPDYPWHRSGEKVGEEADHAYERPAWLEAALSGSKEKK